MRASCFHFISLTRASAAVVEDALEKLFLVSERSTRNRNALLVLDLIPILIHLIKTSRYVELQAGAVKVLASLARETRAQAALRNAGGIDTVVYLANHKPWLDDHEVCLQRCLSLHRLLTNNLRPSHMSCCASSASRTTRRTRRTCARPTLRPIWFASRMLWRCPQYAHWRSTRWPPSLLRTRPRSSISGRQTWLLTLSLRFGRASSISRIADLD